MRSDGFSLIEIILALALTAIVIAGVTNGMLLMDGTVKRIEEEAGARAQLETCVPVIRWLRDADGIAALVSGTSGLDDSSGAWALNGESDSDGTYTRTVTITDEETDLKRVQCVVAWGEGALTASVSTVTHISR